MLDVESSAHSPAFPIVGVGASAGGLEAFTLLLRHLPSDTRLGFVLIQHLDPTHPSLLSEVLRQATAMPVRQAEHGMRVEPSHVYVIAPNTDIAIHDGRLVLSPRRSEGLKPYLPIDFFLRSLAAELGNRAIGVILSGGAPDGTEGLRAIRAEDGISFAQEPRSAKFPGMPQSAIDAGVVDYRMDIPRLADELVRLSRHPYEQSSSPRTDDADDLVRAEIFAHVRKVIGIDFSEFKPSTVARRLARRMALRAIVDLRAYSVLLEAEPDEVRALYEDILIHVTSFFRDPEVYASLRSQVFPEILKHKSEGATVRVWVAGCSSGEEVYSLAIAWLEFSAELSGSHPLQIFGSDVSEVSIQKARAGVYSESTLRDVSDERRKRYFGKVDGGYRISKRVRDQCIFVRHDLVRDPPFSRLDIVSCRNVLIYFDQPLQKQVLPTLHYCLTQPGFLVLGRSENIAGFSQLFSEFDKANKIFKRTAAASSLRFVPRGDMEQPAMRIEDRRLAPFPRHGAGLAKHLDRLLLARYCPPGVLVNENLEVVLFRGQTGSYLQAAPGEPQNNLIGMARGGLVSALSGAIAQAKLEMVAVSRAGVEVDQDGSTKMCDLLVIPFSGLPDSREPLFVVLFEESSSGVAHEPIIEHVPDVEPPSSPERRRSARLEHELGATKEYMRTLIEEHGRASDELGSSNEELISGNEELQSMNEELETAKEELQSINEELTTLNDELQRRNLELAQTNGDLVNFALTVDIAIVTLDKQRRIRRFTPRARELLNVLPADVGRTLEEIELGIEVPDLSRQITEVMATASVKETEVKDEHGRWYRMQIRPYTTADHKTDGVILSLVDIHELKQLVNHADDAREQAEGANRAKDDFLATLSHELRTPLSSMLLNAQRVRGGGVTDQETMRRIGESLERATWMQVKLIDDLLDVSRIVAGKLVLERRSLGLVGVVQAAVDNVNALAEAKELVLDLTFDPELEPIWADYARVQQVATNLLTNAIKFTPHGGKVTVIVDQEAGSARLRVIDTGIGIDAGFLPHVFAHFSQSDTSITRQYGGLGLGLALVRHLVELHGGTVHAESAGVDCGATFTVTFPIAHAAVRTDAGVDAEVQATPVAKALDRPGKTLAYDVLTDLRVLFVDDDLRTREAVQEVLRLAGAQVELAESVADGMLAVEAFKPQVILCDIAMPGEDGYAFMRKLRAREAAGATPIPALAFTALAAEDDRRRAMTAGFRLHLAKPIDIDRLRNAVLELATMASAPRALQELDA